MWFKIDPSEHLDYERTLSIVLYLEVFDNKSAYFFSMIPVCAISMFNQGNTFHYFLLPKCYLIQFELIVIKSMETVSFFWVIFWNNITTNFIHPWWFLNGYKKHLDNILKEMWFQLFESKKSRKNFYSQPSMIFHILSY